jgi:hypothetical protein
VGLIDAQLIKSWLPWFSSGASTNDRLIDGGFKLKFVLDCAVADWMWLFAFTES